MTIRIKKAYHEATDDNGEHNNAVVIKDIIENPNKINQLPKLTE